MTIKSKIIDNLKNIHGWSTNRKIIVISVDDYGNVRIDSKDALANILKSGSKVQSRFDEYDALENTIDLEMLYEALTSVKDKNGNNAIFTPFAMPCNIDFESMKKNGYSEYKYELLPNTFEKLKGYENSWNLWKEGIMKKIMAPEFHGREHFNLKIFNEKLLKKDSELLNCLQNRSMGCISNSGYSTISYTAAFEFYDFVENENFKEIIYDGLDNFEKVFGFKSIYFNPPGGREHPVIHKWLQEKGVKYIDTLPIKQEHLGENKQRFVYNYTGKKNKMGQLFLVRNVVFEPTEYDGRDWVKYTMSQIETAFKWNKPAIISSHRVNFCGQIDEKNRFEGVKALRELLKSIVKKWPDVEFMSARDLAILINKDNEIS